MPQINLTPYHAKYFAFELTKKSPSDSVEKFASTLVDIQVENPLKLTPCRHSKLTPFGQMKLTPCRHFKLTP